MMSFLFNHLPMTSNTVGFCQAGSWMTLLSGHLVAKHDETTEFMGIFNGLTYIRKNLNRKPSIFP